jgi:hypothetical protein
MMSLSAGAVRCSGSRRPRRSRWSSSIRGSYGSEIVGSAHRDFLPSVYGVNARYRAWFRRLGRDLARQNCRRRVSQPEIYHSCPSEFGRDSGCARDGGSCGPLSLASSLAEAGGGMRSRPAASLLHPFCFAPDQPPWCEIGSSVRPLPGCRLDGKSAPLPSSYAEQGQPPPD